MNEKGVVWAPKPDSNFPQSAGPWVPCDWSGRASQKDNAHPAAVGPMVPVLTPIAPTSR